MNAIPRTIEDIATLVRLLAMSNRPLEPHRPSSNLVDPPLIAQLRTNIVPDGDGAAGARKLAGERVQINPAALDLYQWLEQQVATIYTQGTDLPANGSPEEMLVGWYVAIAIANAADEIPDTLMDQLYDRLDGWRTRILDLFNPPERGTIPHPCPNCGWTWMTMHTADGDVRQYALVRLVRPWRQEVAVRCRKCGHDWTGEDELMELAASLGITSGQITDYEPDTPADEPVDDAPMVLCVMTREQANEYARTHDIPPARIAVASSSIDRIRRTTRPIVTVRHDTYAPGPHEKARVDETLRIAERVNTMNGHTQTETTDA